MVVEYFHREPMLLNELPFHLRNAHLHRHLRRDFKLSYLILTCTYIDYIVLYYFVKSIKILDVKM